MSELKTIHMESAFGIDLRKTYSPISIIRIYQYRCTKPFADIREDEIIFAGLDPSKGMIISNERWRGCAIGIALFHEHFEMDEPWFPSEPVTGKNAGILAKLLHEQLSSRRFYR